MRLCSTRCIEMPKIQQMVGHIKSNLSLREVKSHGRNAMGEPAHIPAGAVVGTLTLVPRLDLVCAYSLTRDPAKMPRCSLLGPRIHSHAGWCLQVYYQDDQTLYKYRNGSVVEEARQDCPTSCLALRMRRAVYRASLSW
jgi:hypothetical protein